MRLDSGVQRRAARARQGEGSLFTTVEGSKAVLAPLQPATWDAAHSLRRQAEPGAGPWPRPAAGPTPSAVSRGPLHQCPPPQVGRTIKAWEQLLAALQGLGAQVGLPVPGHSRR